MINSYTSWQPLEEVIVGRAYSPDYFDFIDDAQVRNQMQQILSETEEDLNNLQKTIETYGARVRRPNLPPKDQFVWWQTEDGGAPLPPLTPRDWQISLGQKLLRVLPMEELDEICSDYADQVVSPHNGRWDPDCILNQASASCIVRVGRDVNLNLAGDFPGWEVLKIWDSSIWAAMEVGKFKYEQSPGAWYVQGQTPTQEFTKFVDTYLNKWTGFVAETVFDVNCLVLDEENVDFCKKHRINPIISELRHSYFWDGGISCCTQDLTRKGGLESYL